MVRLFKSLILLTFSFALLINVFRNDDNINASQSLSLAQIEQIISNNPSAAEENIVSNKNKIGLQPNTNSSKIEDEESFKFLNK